MSNEKKEMLLNKLVQAMELIGEVHSELMADTDKAEAKSDEGGTNPGNPPPPPPPPPGGN